jgi:phosphate-selective porin OprO/OprP
MNTLNKQIITALVGTGLSLTSFGQTASLEERIQALEKKLESQPTVTSGPEGVRFTSADKSYQLRLEGVLQTDARFYLDSASSANDGFQLRRVRPTLRSTVGEKGSFRITPEFGGNSTSLLDAWLGYSISPAFGVQIGKFKAPFGLERLQSGNWIRFVERAHPTSLAPNRDIGIQFAGKASVVDWALLVSNGTTDGGSTSQNTDDHLEATGRVFVNVAPGLHIGVAGNVGESEGELASYRTPGQQAAFAYLAEREGPDGETLPGTEADGDHRRFSPQFTYYTGPFGLLGEYVVVNRDVRNGDDTTELENTAWQIATSYVLTGEKNDFGGITPAQSFDPASTFDGGASKGTDKPGEDYLFARFQVAF